MEGHRRNPTKDIVRREEEYGRKIKRDIICREFCGVQDRSKGKDRKKGTTSAENKVKEEEHSRDIREDRICLLYTSPSPRD